LNILQVLNYRSAARVEEVFAGTSVARSASQPLAEVCQTMLDRNPLSEALPTRFRFRRVS
jgi:hypothetical protein